LDVFTDRRFAGNPLAVVLEAQGLEDNAMQAIAREFSHPETVFVFAPADPGHRARLRIFTPARELPFAGHPTVGTAVLLALSDLATVGDDLATKWLPRVQWRVSSATWTAGQQDNPKMAAPERARAPRIRNTPNRGVPSFGVPLPGNGGTVAQPRLNIVIYQ